MGDMNFLFWIGPIIAVVVVIFVVLRVVLPIFRLKSQTQALLASGIPAEATILQAQQTGSKLTIGGQEQWGVALTLEVRPQGRPPYAAQTQTFVSLLQLPRVQPGATVPVKISPQNPTQVALDLDAGFTSAAFSPAGSLYAQPQQQAEQMLLELDARHRDLVARGNRRRPRFYRRSRPASPSTAIIL